MWRLVPWSRQTFRLVRAMKLLGIMLRNRCWPTTFHTITAGDGDGWCLCDQPLMHRSHQTLCLVPTMKLLGIMFINRYWLTTLDTFTVMHANRWCQKWPEWSTPQGVAWGWKAVVVSKAGNFAPCIWVCWWSTSTTSMWRLFNLQIVQFFVCLFVLCINWSFNYTLNK